jgi:hypothetical protein
MLAQPNTSSPNGGSKTNSIAWMRRSRTPSNAVVRIWPSGGCAAISLHRKYTQSSPRAVEGEHDACGRARPGHRALGTAPRLSSPPHSRTANGFSWFDAQRAGIPVRTHSIIAPYASGEHDHGAASVWKATWQQTSTAVCAITIDLIPCANPKPATLRRWLCPLFEFIHRSRMDAPQVKTASQARRWL